MNEGVLVPSDQLRRIGQATIKIENLESPVIDKAGRRRRGLIRAILLEPLYGGWHALAQVCVRQRYSRLVEVQIVGAAHSQDAWSLRVDLRIPEVSGPIESLPFTTRSSAAEVYAALMATLPVSSGDLFVTSGRISGLEVPTTLRHEPDAVYVLARWTIAFAGSIFEGLTPTVDPVNLSGSDAMILSSAATWRPTSEIIEVIEGGLNPDQVRAYGQYITSRFPLVAGSVVLADYSEGANGYVVTSAEPRKFRIS